MGSFDPVSVTPQRVPPGYAIPSASQPPQLGNVAERVCPCLLLASECVGSHYTQRHEGINLELCSEHHLSENTESGIVPTSLPSPVFPLYVNCLLQ